jgi:2Fe-2S ferredoxin
MKLIVTDRDGAVHRLGAKAGDVLMPLLRDHVDNAVGICGGVISCGTCRVRVDDDWADRLAPASLDEAEMIEALTDEAGFRLGCQIVLTDDLDGLAVTIAPET